MATKIYGHLSRSIAGPEYFLLTFFTIMAIAEAVNGERLYTVLLVICAFQVSILIRLRIAEDITRQIITVLKTLSETLELQGDAVTDCCRGYADTLRRLIAVLDVSARNKGDAPR